ncbi:MAG: 50S ribosomal protein L18 [Helicobacteraceae bacterium 4484_230]|nr:MAG: 50S ribosomal protein L18 [Helicobacteraceae bacterium 4484_230]
MNLKTMKKKTDRRIQRKRRIRANIAGTAAKPRISVFRSNRYLSAQAIDDAASTTVAAIHSKPLSLKANMEDAAKLGEAFAATLKGAGITEIVFDRNGYVYHGVIKSFAEALRANEIKF